MFRTIVWIGKCADNAPIFEYQEGSQTLRFNFLPAYPFLNGRLYVQRGGNIVLRSTEIAREGPAQFVAFHGLVELQSFFGHSPNLGTRWELHAYDFIPGDHLIFATAKNPDLLEKLLWFHMFRRSPGSGYISGQVPPSDFCNNRQQRKQFNKAKKRKKLELLICA